MSRIYGQVGMWHHEVAITVDDEGFEKVLSWNTGRRVRLSVKERLVRISPVSVGVGYLVSNRGECVKYDRGLALRWELVEHLDKPLTRFELCDVTWAEDEQGLFTTIAPDHLLPWPKLRKCEGYDVVEEAMAEVERRMRSAAAAHKDQPPAKWSGVCPPEDIKKMLPREFWGDCVRRVRDDAPAIAA